MNQNDTFYEFVKRNSKSVTVLFVGKKKARLPPGSVFRKTYDKIFSKRRRLQIKSMKLKCGVDVDYIR